MICIPCAFSVFVLMEFDDLVLVLTSLSSFGHIKQSEKQQKTQMTRHQVTTLVSSTFLSGSQKLTKIFIIIFFLPILNNNIFIFFNYTRSFYRLRFSSGDSLMWRVLVSFVLHSLSAYLVKPTLSPLPPVYI